MIGALKANKWIALLVASLSCCSRMIWLCDFRTACKSTPCTAMQIEFLFDFLCMHPSRTSAVLFSRRAQKSLNFQFGHARKFCYSFKAATGHYYERPVLQQSPALPNSRYPHNSYTQARDILDGMGFYIYHRISTYKHYWVILRTLRRYHQCIRSQSPGFLHQLPRHFSVRIIADPILVKL